MCIVSLFSFFSSPFEHKSVYNDIKLCHEIEVFAPAYLNANNKLHEAFWNPQYTVLTISKLKQINNKSFYRLLIIVLGDISLNPGPACKDQILNTTKWDIFKTKGLHLMHLNIKNFLMTLKMFSLKSICQKPSVQLLELFTDLRIKLISLKLSMKILRNLIQLIKKLTFLEIST